jgi:hypothetical protein
VRELVFNIEIWEANTCNQSLWHINQRTNLNTHFLIFPKKFILSCL